MLKDSDVSVVVRRNILLTGTPNFSTTNVIIWKGMSYTLLTFSDTEFCFTLIQTVDSVIVTCAIILSLVALSTL